jgi:glycerol-1-phosphate dehydrogenase [NAD(P)+]
LEHPQVFTFTEGDEAAAAAQLAESLDALKISSPLLLVGAHGEGLASGVAGAIDRRPVSEGANQDWSSSLGSAAHRAGADAIVAIGGGRTLDIGKLAAARAGIAVISVPTQLSHDGICSPIAVVPDHEGRPESLGAIMPAAVFLSMPTLLEAPEASLRAGLGDLLANPFALRDWKLAEDRGLETTDQRSWDLSAQAYDLVDEIIENANLGARLEILPRLADGLVLSGMAMIEARSSRPASGGEHEISHAIDELHGGRAMHGEQVAFGCIISAALYGEDAAALRARLRAIGLPSAPQDLGLDEDGLVEVILHAPDTRPGRFTILEHSDLDEAGARSLVKKLFADA